MRTSRTYRITASAVMATVAAATIVTFARADDTPKQAAAPSLPAVSDSFRAPSVSSPDPTQSPDPTTAPPVAAPAEPSPSASTATSRSAARKPTTSKPAPAPSHSPSPSPSPSQERSSSLGDLLKSLLG